MKFLDAGGGIVGKVDVGAGESVGDAGGGDAFGCVRSASSLIRTKEVSVLGLRIEMSHALREVNGGPGCGAG